MCMKPATLSRQLQNTRLVAKFCGEKCVSYLMSDEPMPVEMHIPSTESRLVFSVCSNGVTFGIAKGKVSIYVLQSDKPDIYQVLYQVRHAYEQKIQVFFTSHDFQPMKLENETHEEGKIVEELKQSKIFNILNETMQKIAVNTKQLIEQKSESAAASDSETNAEESDENLSLNLLDL